MPDEPMADVKMVEVVLRGPSYHFQCIPVAEARARGIIDYGGKKGTHSPVSVDFEQGDGAVLSEWLGNLADAILIVGDRNRIKVYRPRELVREVQKEAEPPGNPLAGMSPHVSRKLHQGRCGRGRRSLEGVDGAKVTGADGISKACTKVLGTTPKSNTFLFSKKRRES